MPRIVIGSILGVAPAARASPDPAPPSDEAPASWWGGDHATGGWGGARKALDDRGVQIDVVYASDVFTAHGHVAALGHVDAALTLDTDKLVGWPGGTIYVLGQNNHGDVINDVDRVGSAVGVTNLEADPYTQLTELFLEQSWLGGELRIRLGKQDANRDFGTPRFGGNFINNNFGMFPNAPLPSYPTTGLGAIVIVQPTDWLLAKAALYEASPGVGGLGLTTALDAGAGYVAAASLAVTHHYGPNQRDGGTTSVGAWWQADDDDGVGIADPARFHDNVGVFVQNDERIYLHPENAQDPRGLTVIARYSYARADRSTFPHYAGGSAAWHGIAARSNDTAGIGGGYFTLRESTSEWFVEAFYKLRLTNFLSVQPDVQWFRHPGGAGRDALVGGVRFKIKL
ncbi:MAG TPA: carbohydrate porin [Kofleriaceae bacterium]|nr:carbohydrate porin [Kofleriaceae bacterium]